MLPFMRERFGNAASIDHAFGAAAREAVEKARHQVATLVGARPEDVVFTSGATESNNIALSADLPLVTGTIEHPSVRDAAQGSSRGLREIRWLGVDASGTYAVPELTRLLSVLPSPALVSLMTVNNEIGSIQPVELLSQIIRSGGHFFHTDATQAAAYLPFTFSLFDAVSISAHKIYGPKGIAALVCDTSLRRLLRPLHFGGGHERGLRSGTLNVPAIVGFGVAAASATRDRLDRARILSKLSDAFKENLRRAYGGQLRFNAERTSAPHICSVRMVGVNARALLSACRASVCFSLGSACATSKSEPSYVLTELGLSEDEANETIRCSFSHELTRVDVVDAARTIALSANRLLEFSMA